MKQTSRKTSKRVTVPGVSIWPQPKRNPRRRYNITYGPRGNRTTITASTDLQTTIDMAIEISKRQERIRVGHAPASHERFAAEDRKPITEHLANYRAALADLGRDAAHVRQMHDAARDVLIGSVKPDPAARNPRGPKSIVLAGCGVARISQIIASSVLSQIGTVKRSRSAATANRYLDAVNGFLNWGVEDGRWERNVCKHLPHYVVASDRRRERRAIELSDFIRLVETTEASAKVRMGLSGYRRSLIYRTCITTGLRAKQARGLLVSDLLVAGEGSGVWAQAIINKNKTKRFKPLPYTLAQELWNEATWLHKRHSDPLLDVPKYNAAKMLRQDLEAVGIAYKTPEGYFDFHSIRHQSGAVLISMGVRPKAVQNHLGHSTYKLTMDTYGHLLDEDRLKVARVLPQIDSAQRSVKRAGGRECPPVSASVREGDKETAMAGKKTQGGQWSHGESNPDLLNAIQQIDLRRSNLRKGLIVHVGDEVAPREARRRVRRALRKIGAATGQPVHVIAKGLRGRKGGRR